MKLLTSNFCEFLFLESDIRSGTYEDINYHAEYGKSKEDVWNQYSKEVINDMQTYWDHTDKVTRTKLLNAYTNNLNMWRTIYKSELIWVKEELGIL